MISFAVNNDIPDLVKLINAAYRGEASRAGWTTEADLVDGESRTDTVTLKEMMNGKENIFLKYTGDGKIQGCVFLQKQHEKLYLGMLSVSPTAQAMGIGKKMLAASEEFARVKACTAIIMQVISLRYELVNWYLKHGYYPTGETRPFPPDNKFGTPTRPLEFVVLEKIVT